eukprot:13746763-Alexandrium_andersonii.AAC.1
MSAEPHRSLQVYGKREVNFVATDESGREMEIKVDFLVIDVHCPILSVGQLQQVHVSTFFAPEGGFIERGGQRFRLRLR